ncbi:MAG TPA: hypothetical protein VFE05_14020 [Longimicrobiaceae bacterium]|jgi:hypothetical protein|nr:hypothetical protein [Longimicrobiaceae bacterium]
MTAYPMRLDPMSLSVESFVPADDPSVGDTPVPVAASVLFSNQAGDCSSHCFAETNRYNLC